MTIGSIRRKTDATTFRILSKIALDNNICVTEAYTIYTDFFLQMQKALLAGDSKNYSSYKHYKIYNFGSLVVPERVFNKIQNRRIAIVTESDFDGNRPGVNGTNVYITFDRELFAVGDIIVYGKRLKKRQLKVIHSDGCTITGVMFDDEECVYENHLVEGCKWRKVC